MQRNEIWIIIAKSQCAVYTTLFEQVNPTALPGLSWYWKWCCSAACSLDLLCSFSEFIALSHCEFARIEFLTLLPKSIWRNVICLGLTSNKELSFMDIYGKNWKKRSFLMNFLFNTLFMYNSPLITWLISQNLSSWTSFQTGVCSVGSQMDFRVATHVHQPPPAKRPTRKWSSGRSHRG